MIIIIGIMEAIRKRGGQRSSLTTGFDVNENEIMQVG